jgi:hypothetical protein
MQTATLVKVFPTKVWLDSGIDGTKRIMMQHEGVEPFEFIAIHYDHRYTCNSHQYQLAEKIMALLGASPTEDAKP